MAKEKGIEISKENTLLMHYTENDLEMEALHQDVEDKDELKEVVETAKYLVQKVEENLLPDCVAEAICRVRNA